MDDYEEVSEIAFSAALNKMPNHKIPRGSKRVWRFTEPATGIFRHLRATLSVKKATVPLLFDWNVLSMCKRGCLLGFFAPQCLWVYFKMSCLTCRNKRGVAIAEKLLERKSKKIMLLFWHAKQNKPEVYVSCTSTLRFLKGMRAGFLCLQAVYMPKNLNPPQRRRQQPGSFCQHKNTRCKNLQFVLLQQDYVGHCLAGSSNFQIFLGNGGRVYCFQMWLGLLWPSPCAKLKNHLLATK